MTDLRKFKDISFDFIVMQHVYFINNNSIKISDYWLKKGGIIFSLQIVSVHSF